MVTDQELDDAMELVDLQDNTTDAFTLALLRMLVDAVKELLNRG